MMFTCLIALTSLFLGTPPSTGLVKPAPPTAKILAEGLHLFQSERASWVATDLMLASVTDREQIGGYLSYFRDDSVCTIFWPVGTTARAGGALLARYTFPLQSVRAENAVSKRLASFTKQEAKLFAVRESALAEINKLENEYLTPANTSLNLVLLEDENEFRLYVLTGPQEGGVVPMGNDHLLTFNRAGKLLTSERLHNSYLPMQKGTVNGPVESLMHSHLAAYPYITPTDICASLLYQQETTAHKLIVISQQYVSLFDMANQSLLIVTRQAFEKMFKKY